MFKSSIGVAVLCAAIAAQHANATSDMGAVPSPPAPTSSRTAQDKCGLDVAKRFVGSKAEASVRHGVAKLVRHNRIRWIRPGRIVTQDYRADRLNMITDEDGRIMTVRCG